MSDPVLVVGATGTHGGAVARGLLRGGFKVHALVRDDASARAQALKREGALLATGDLDQVQTLERAFSDVATVYGVTTPFEQGTGEEERQGANIIRAAATVRLSWLVMASVAAADRAPVPHFASKWRIEQQLWAAGIPATVIAPSYFYENVAGAIEAGEPLRLALPADTPLHQVALDNLGAMVAAVLNRREEHLGERIEIAADAPTPQQMAAALNVEYHELALEEVRARSPDLAAMYAFLADEGYGIDVQALRARYPEVSWVSFSAWARSRVD